MQEDASKVFEQSATMMQEWTDLVGKMTLAAFSVSPTAPPPEAFRQMRDKMLAELEASWEQFLRSPAFLEMSRQSLEGSMAVRGQLSQMMTQIRHETQGVAREDVDSLMQAIRHLETRTLDRIEALERRLNEVTGQLAANGNGQVSASIDHLLKQVEKLSAQLEGAPTKAKASEETPTKAKAKKAPSKRTKK